MVIAALGQLGIQTTSFVAIVGAAGLAVGLALQGSLANFAAAVLILIFRPFKVGDFVEVAGVSGVVQRIQICTTELHSPDNKKIIVPNGGVISGNITNYSANDTRRVDLVLVLATAMILMLQKQYWNLCWRLSLQFSKTLHRPSQWWSWRIARSIWCAAPGLLPMIIETPISILLKRRKRHWMPKVFLYLFPNATCICTMWVR